VWELMTNSVLWHTLCGLEGIDDIIEEESWAHKSWKVEREHNFEFRSVLYSVESFLSFVCLWIYIMKFFIRIHILSSGSAKKKSNNFCLCSWNGPEGRNYHHTYSSQHLPLEEECITWNRISVVGPNNKKLCSSFLLFHA